MECLYRLLPTEYRIYFADRYRFLWIHLVLQIILEDCDSPYEVKLAVKSLPSDLEAVYARCLTRKRKNRRPSDVKLLIWVCAAPKPLDIDALRELLAMDMETGQVSTEKMPARELLLQSGVGLVALDMDEQLVLPVHSTARRFVFSELARGHFQSTSTSAASDGTWPLHLEAGRWSEANFRSALGSLCLFHIKQRTTRDLGSTSEPTRMRVPQPDMPKFWRQLIPARFDSRAVDASIKSSPFRLNLKQASVNQFLRYAIENWLPCNKNLAPDDEDFPWMRREAQTTGSRTSTELFEGIAKERNDSFGVHPWPSVPGSFNSHLSNMFAYAVANDHVPLLRAVKRNHRSLPKRAFDLPLASHGQLLAVHVAAKKGFDYILSELADICDLDAVCLSTGKRALHFAAEAGSGDCLEILLQERRRDLNARDKKGRTPLFVAALAGHEEIVTVLYETGRVDTDAKDKDGLTPLWWASRYGHDKVVEFLLATGKTEIEVQDECSRSPLSQAAEHGHDKVVRLLIETGKSKVNGQDKSGLSPLSHAAMNGHCRAVEVLLRTGKADVETRDFKDWTPLTRATVAGHHKVVEMLLVIGKADVDAREIGGWNALFHAADEGHGKVVEVLLVAGETEIDAKDRCGVTSLWRAVEEGRFDAVQVLLATGRADLDVVDYADTDMLSLAVKKGHYKVARRLREALEEKGDTPGSQLAS
jgi:ankyrin repeat protein